MKLRNIETVDWGYITHYTRINFKDGKEIKIRQHPQVPKFMACQLQ